MTEWCDLPDDVLPVPFETKTPSRFKVETWNAITFDGREEWAIKQVLPRQGLAALYGKPGSLKSFVALDIALSIALGRQWAGRRVTQASVVYVAAEGAGGLRKRKEGFLLQHPELPTDVPFALIAAAPHLGTDKGDLAELIRAIEGARQRPGLIVLDTLAQTLGAADENGAGMTAFVANVGTLAAHFNALVLIVHHVGISDDRRMRGHSSLHGALDAQILCERRDGDLAATLTLQKLKDDASDVRLVARLSRVVVAHDEDGDEISTLVVELIENAEPSSGLPRSKSIPMSQRLLMDTIAQAIDEAGESYKPFGASGATVRGVDDSVVRDRYYGRIAETPKLDDTPKKLADRRRQAFNTALKRCLDGKFFIAASKNGRRFVWLP